MKILYITGQIASHGGIERVTIMKLNYLVITGNEVFLSTYEQMGRPLIYPLSDNVEYTDIAVNYNVDYNKESLYSWRCIKLVWKHIQRTRKLINRIKPDVIVVPNFGYEYWFLPFIKGNSSIIREFHDSQYCVNHHRLKYAIDDFIQKLYDRIVVLTPQEKEYFKYKKNIEIIPNPVALSENVSDLCAKKIISIGRIDMVKGFEKLIEIAALVNRKHPDWIFEIYGNGETSYVNYLRQIIHEACLDNVILLKGHTSDVWSKLVDASIYLCTSKTESFGLTLVEAMSAGLPVVSFDCPNGPRNIIHNGEDGFLVDIDSVEKASTALIFIIENIADRKRLGKNAYENSLRFCIDLIMKRWLNLFGEII